MTGRVVAALALLCAVAGPSGASPGPELCRSWLHPSQPPTIRGRVLDADSRPLAGARILLSASPEMSPLLGWVESDPAGRYAASVPEGPGCAALRLPATVYAVLEPPLGRFISAAPARALSIASARADLSVDWRSDALVASASVCGRVELLGRPLPSGFVFLAPNDRSATAASRDGGLSRVSDGKFCARGVAPGEYLLSVRPELLPSPQDNGVLPSPLTIVFRGQTRACDECEVSVDPSGRVAVYDGNGRYVPAAVPLELVYQPPGPRGSSVLLSGRLKAPGDARPALLFVRTDQSSPTWSTTNHFAWLSAGVEGEPFAVPLAPGRMLNFWARSAELASVDIRYAKPLNPLAAARPLMEIVLGPSGGISGEVRTADGARFHPHLSRGRARRLFAVRSSSFWEDDHGEGAFADSDGHYEATHLRPGFYRLWPVTGADGFEESVGVPRGLWVKARVKRRADWTLSPWAMLRIAQDAGRLEPPAGSPPPGANTVPFHYARPLERWIVGVKPGELDETGVSGLLLNDEAPANFLQDAGGGWIPRRSWDRRRPSDGVRVAPGRLDLYMLEVSDRFGRASLRVSGKENGILIRAGEEASVKFSTPAYAGGRGALRGLLKSSRRVALSRFLEARSLAEMHALLTPRIQLYDDQGRFAAAAFVGLSYSEFGEIIDAAGSGDESSFDRLADRRARDFYVEGLAAGRYAVEVRAHGYRARRSAVEIRDGETARLEADLDRSE